MLFFGCSKDEHFSCFLIPLTGRVKIAQNFTSVSPLTSLSVLSDLGYLLNSNDFLRLEQFTLVYLFVTSTTKNFTNRSHGSGNDSFLIDTIICFTIQIFQISFTDLNEKLNEILCKLPIKLYYLKN